MPRFQMILTHLKQYLRRHGHATLPTLARRFNMQPDAIRGMLEHWVHKGSVQKHEIRACCRGCSHCDAPGTEVYEWIAS